MANGKSNAGWWIFGVLAVLGILYWVYTQGWLAKYGFGIAKINDEGEESECNDTGNDPNGRVSARSYTCFPPLAPQFFLVFSGGPKGDVKERAWTRQVLSAEQGKEWVDNVVTKSQTPGDASKFKGTNKTWTFNQIRVDDSTGTEYFLFVDNPAYRNYVDYPKV